MRKALITLITALCLTLTGTVYADYVESRNSYYNRLCNTIKETLARTPAEGRYAHCILTLKGVWGYWSGSRFVPSTNPNCAECSCEIFSRQQQ